MSRVQKPKLLAVLEPFASIDGPEECDGALEWMMVTLDIDWVNSALACDGRHGFIHEVRGLQRSTGSKEVFVHESVGCHIMKTQH